MTDKAPPEPTRLHAPSPNPLHRHRLMLAAGIFAAQNPDMAAGLGVNTRRVATWTFAYGAGLADAGLTTLCLAIEEIG